MSVKKEIIKKVMVMENPEEIGEDDINDDKRKVLGRIKRKYRIIVIFGFFLILILLFMMFPVLIALIWQNL